MDAGPVDIKYGDNIGSIAARIASNSGLPTQILGNPTGKQSEGTYVNALRHVLWQAMLTQKYGRNIAAKIGFAHEENPEILVGKDKNTVEFYYLSEADSAVDILNNIIGRSIGEAYNIKIYKNKDIFKSVATTFYTNGFWVVGQTPNNTYALQKITINIEQLHEIQKTIDARDEFAFSKEGREAYEEIKKYRKNNNPRSDGFF